MSECDATSILFLEDDPEDYRLLTAGVRNRKNRFVIDWVTTLAEAIEKAGQRHYDVVLTDLNVPDSIGLETVARLKEVCQGVPIIALTGNDDEIIEREILECGAQDYLVKGELGGRFVQRAIMHAVQRQHSVNEIHSLVQKLQQSQELLAEHTQLLHKKNLRLRRLYRTAQEFVDNVSHDFRTPLTVIKDYVSIVREGMVGVVNDKQKEMLDKVGIRADDLNNMVDDLLDLSKCESGLLGAWRRKLELREVVDRVIPLLQQRAQVRNTKLVVEIPEELPHVYCDAEKASRVITNLAVNAIKFAGENGCVTLSAEEDPVGNQVIISVGDDGPGIDKESLQRIFQRFRQLNSHVKSTVKGFGLGLNIAQKLSELNLGELSVQSKLGVGSTFSFTIPVAKPTEVLRKWLRHRSSANEILRTIEIGIDSEVESASNDEFDSFLNCLLRPSDLLLRITPHRWLLVMAVPSSEAERWFERTQKEFARTNENRPLGPLPPYHATVRGEWSAATSSESVLEEFSWIVKENTSAETIA